MKFALIRRGCLVASLCSALIGAARGQVLTGDTMQGTDLLATGYAGALANDIALTQTFSGISGIDTITFRFLSAGVNSISFGPGTVDYVFGEWSNATGATSTLQSSIASGQASLADASSWTSVPTLTSPLTDYGFNVARYFDVTFDLSNYVLDSSRVYGLTFFGNGFSAANGIALEKSLYGPGSPDYYAGGTAYALYSSGYSAGQNLGTLAAISGDEQGTDFAFTASAISPVPESSTMAVMLAGLFVAGLVIVRRRRQATVGVN
ncbi:PEP-CTERM sorting domain-containing protein [Horticoccus luteus]|uniref:PEP-CTERM sorting domain-containing protein n=1 Tax=Horticoccus luteus TaxID=2862869 RepID=A0A8F9TTI0_9BACT|nr:PEP-CTERM sorting domain-containing protein [Horticoccus luteus]QYM77766.1 PEP-CTERM sorting domain-containing protein [Horticoccus luteus]